MNPLTYTVHTIFNYFKIHAFTKMLLAVNCNFLLLLKIECKKSKLTGNAHNAQHTYRYMLTMFFANDELHSSSCSAEIHNMSQKYASATL